MATLMYHAVNTKLKDIKFYSRDLTKTIIVYMEVDKIVINSEQNRLLNDTNFMKFYIELKLAIVKGTFSEIGNLGSNCGTDQYF